MAKQWYIIHTYSGFEDRVKKTLEQRVEALGMTDFFGEIQVPTETVVEIKNGKRREVRRKFFPGYVLVEMEMTDDAWHLVRNTPKVTGFRRGRQEAHPADRRRSESDPPPVGGDSREAAAEGDVREGRADPDHRRAVRFLQRRDRGRQPRSVDGQGDGDHLRAATRRWRWSSAKCKSCREGTSMAKKVVGQIKLQLPAGQATPAPPVGPALGQHGLNIMDFCKAFNARTQRSAGHHHPRHHHGVLRPDVQLHHQDPAGLLPAAQGGRAGEGLGRAQPGQGGDAHHEPGGGDRKNQDA